LKIKGRGEEGEQRGGEKRRPRAQRIFVERDNVREEI
jgi:hypothetical protein